MFNKRSYVLRRLVLLFSILSLSFLLWPFIAYSQQACPPGQTNCGAVCVNLFTDSQNCGGCGMVCPPVPNGTAGCIQGVCGFLTCSSGFADCDGIAANGCETNINTDLRNCGACGKVCPLGTTGCISGVCTSTCPPGQAKCGAVCVNIFTDSQNCGACGKVCPPVRNGTAGCIQGVCGILACSSGFADCDGIAANGCETNINTDLQNCGACGKVCRPGTTACISGACSSTCPPGQTKCGAGCVDMFTDSQNCGACGKVCPIVRNGTAGCIQGVCGILTCSSGFADCDGIAANGCETNINRDLRNCGACGKVCPSVPNGTAGCIQGACGFLTCSSGFADCDGIAANGCETNINTDLRNCGRCGNVCPVGTPCSDGTCVAAGATGTRIIKPK